MGGLGAIASPPQYLADQLSLSRPGRADYAYHNAKYLPPRFSDFPTTLSSAHTNTLCFYLASKVKWHSWLITLCAWVFSPNKRDFVSYFQSLFKGPEATKFVYSVVSSGSTQGPLKKWTEHLTQSHFLKLHLREDPRSTFSVGFLHHELRWCRKVHKDLSNENQTLFWTYYKTISSHGVAQTWPFLTNYMFGPITTISE